MSIRILSCLLALALGGCAVYKIDVQQGNEIDPEAVAALRVGMSKREVTKLLGSPMIIDPFHANRWDYYYYLRKGQAGETQQQSVSLVFTGDKLAEIKNRLGE